MLKFVGGVVLGAFVGALAVELVKWKRPDLFEKVERGARSASDRLASAASRGREQTARAVNGLRQSLSKKADGPVS